MVNLHALISPITLVLFFVSALETTAKTTLSNDFDRKSNTTHTTETRYSDTEYIKKLQGFWLGQSIANWTGLITEMDKIGTPETMPFYTDDDWGKKDLKAFWGEYVPHASNIDFYFERKGTPWGADDDTDIEYMYLHLLFSEQATKLTPSLIRDAWLKHTYSNEDAPLFKKFPDSNPIKENFLWVSNEKARVLMAQGVFPPETSNPQINPYYNMIDAQLSTEIFGLLLPNAPDIAIDFSRLAVQTSARNEAESIANFYIAMHSLATSVDQNLSIQEQVIWLADKATKYLHKNEFPIKMYQFVKSHYLANPDKNNWESTRDAVYKRYQVSSHDGYRYAEPYDAGINFAASLISLFYGGGDLSNTIRIGTLTGWDSDNPTATWGGLLGFMLDVEGVKHAFNEHDVSDSYWIHRTRRNFPDYTPNQTGEDTFNLMARRMLRIIRTLEKHNKLTN